MDSIWFFPNKAEGINSVYGANVSWNLCVGNEMVNKSY